MSTRWMLAVLVLGTVGCSGKCGGGGGPGGWLVGDEGLMAQVDDRGALGDGYDLGRTVDLHGIACRGASEAFVVGAEGTLLVTGDAGATWSSVDLGTAATLRAVAASHGDDVLVVGDGAFLLSGDGGAQWRTIASSVASWTSVTSAGADAFAIGDGAVWRWDGATLAPVAPGLAVRAVAAADDNGAVIAAAGDGVWRSADRGATWTAIALPEPVALEAAWVSATGAIVAVGAHGAVVRVPAGAAAGTVDHAGDATLRTLRLGAGAPGLAAGDDGAVIRSADGGLTWTPLDLGLGRTVRGLDQIGNADW